MKLLIKLDTKRINNHMTRFSLFKCDYCNMIFYRKHEVGIKAKSCGCNRIKSITKHGDSDKTRLYSIWHGMKNRCNCPKEKDAIAYRNIKVCKEWNDSYIEFKNWALNNGYKDNLTIDRMDSNKDYEPNNCQWITRKKNSQKTNNRKLNEYKAGLIRILYNKYNIKIKLISWLFDVSYKNIYLILHNKIWI